MIEKLCQKLEAAEAQDLPTKSCSEEGESQAARLSLLRRKLLAALVGSLSEVEKNGGLQAISFMQVCAAGKRVDVVCTKRTVCMRKLFPFCLLYCQLDAVSIVTVCNVLVFSVCVVQLLMFLTSNLDCSREDCDALVDVLKAFIKQLQFGREVSE